MLSSTYVNTLLFGVYPYVCLSVLLIGSLIRFDREPYSWKSDSSQMLRTGQLRLGSNLFHYGVIIVILGHFVGFLAPDWAVDWVLTATAHQLLAMVVGGIAGLVAIGGLTILIARRLGDPRIRLVDAETFERTYQMFSPGLYEKVAPVWAEVAAEPGTILTKEGTTAISPACHISIFRACSAFTAHCSLWARGVTYVTLSIEGFSRFVTSTTAPIATGWSESCRVGLSPTG